jgi:hypothetical protein
MSNVSPDSLNSSGEDTDRGTNNAPGKRYIVRTNSVGLAAPTTYHGEIADRLLPLNLIDLLFGKVSLDGLFDTDALKADPPVQASLPFAEWEPDLSGDGAQA